ncbi:type IV toxin-antitoxin system AbiEi family antitoxin domain-containing protein [Rothia sp. ARF10]|nr:type IV toxin-antitoxin system AbiEi family antitoxin domain-containing protein [Rothia sp. ARF10]
MPDLATLPQPFGRADARGVGITDRRIERAVERGDLTRLAKGLYAVRSPWDALPPWVRHEHLARAGVRLTPDAIVSHLSAAVLLGLPHPAYEPSKVTMTLLDDSRTSRTDAWRRFHRGATPPAHVVIVARRPHLIAARTVVDCIRDLHPRDALAITDAALRRGLCSRSNLDAMRRHQVHWPGIAGADDVLRVTDPRRENWLESVSAWALHSHGLPCGVPQVTVLDRAGRFVARADAVWPDLALVGEADGRGKYELGTGGAVGGDLGETLRRNVHAERIRENRLRDLGLDVMRWDTGDALRVTPLADRFCAARERADPGRVRARFLCGCCRRDLSDCPRTTQKRALSA